MKLTKDERYTAYCILLSEAEFIVSMFELKNDWSPFRHYELNVFGMCDLFEELFGCTPNPIKDYGLKELKSKRPIKESTYWFPNSIYGWKQRISILKKCIKETSNF